MNTRKVELVMQVAGSSAKVMSGEPLNEPIAAHGPFVMNTMQEIREAYNDFHSGKFGHIKTNQMLPNLSSLSG